MGETDLGQALEYQSDDNDNSNRDQEIDATKDDLVNSIDEDIANTAHLMDDADESDEEQAFDDWTETISDSGGSTRDIAPVLINSALQESQKTLKLLNKLHDHHGIFDGLCKDMRLSGHMKQHKNHD